MLVQRLEDGDSSVSTAQHTGACKRSRQDPALGEALGSPVSGSTSFVRGLSHLLLAAGSSGTSRPRMALGHRASCTPPPRGWEGQSPWDAADPQPIPSLTGFNRRPSRPGGAGRPLSLLCSFSWRLPEEQPLGRQRNPPEPFPAQRLTHPEVVKPLGHGPVLWRDLRVEVLVETWLQGDELRQGREVVCFF